ncbi:MAG TPA: hypothetical protein VGO47_02565 [Chlamydiales bacterium]|nr:hypothetical protein [Chlamydiales bacterium]
MELAWAKQYDELTDAYLQWELNGTPALSPDATFHRALVCYDLFDSQERAFPYVDYESITMALMRHGYVGNAPYHPSHAFSIPMLQLFHSLASRAASLS